MRDEKGITLAALVITVIILMILASIAVYSGVSTVRYAGYNRAKNEMHIMQATVNEWYQEYENTEVADDEITEGKTKEQVKLEKFLGNENKYGVPAEDNNDDSYQTALTKTVNATEITAADFRFLDENYMKNTLGLDGNCEFLVNIPERTVILFNGYSYNGKTYYTAEDFEILNVEGYNADSISFNVEQGNIKEIVLSNIEIKLKNTEDDINSGDISKFIVEYKEINEESWKDATNDTIKFTDSNQTKFKFSVPEAGEYDVRISTIDKKLSEQKPIEVYAIVLTEEVTGIYVGTTKRTTLEIDGAFMLSAKSLEEPLTTVNSKYVWKSSNKNVATVTNEGIVLCGNEVGETTITCKGANGTSATCVVTTTANKATEISEEAPIVPAGFTALDTQTAKWKNNESKPDTGKGLVIVDDKGNEFVWVPVENAIYDSSRDGDLPTSTSSGTKNGKTYTPMAIETSNASNQDGTYKDGDSYTYKGILYKYDATAGAYLMYPSATNKQGTASQRREPDTVSRYDNGTYTPTGSSEAKTYLSIIEENIDSKYNTNNAYSNMTNFGNTMQSDYKKMIKSIDTNKGFYIGRYESSLQNGKTRVVAGAKSMTSQESSANRWYGLYARQKNFAVNNGLTSVESDMIWGSQYDAMLNWMTNNSIDVTATGTRNTSRITGSVSTDKINNIYDILGNSYEWTAEANSTESRVHRGGYYVSSYSPSYRSGLGPYYSNGDDGSRSSLYIQ